MLLLIINKSADKYDWQKDIPQDRKNKNNTSTATATAAVINQIDISIQEKKILNKKPNNKTQYN